MNRELQAKGLLTEARVINYTGLVDEFDREIPIVETTDRSIAVGCIILFAAYPQVGRPASFFIIPVGSRNESKPPLTPFSLRDTHKI